MRWAANLLILGGVLLAGYGVLWQVGLAPGSRVTLPAPVALDRATATPTAVLLPVVVPVAAALTAVPVSAAPTLVPAPAPVLLARLPPAPDAVDRSLAAQRPPPGYAVRLAIPAIKLETDVQQAGVVADVDGSPIWETLPFVAVHYGDLTSLVGGPGNAVIAGHVVTLREGNVFRFLYQLDLDDQIQVWDNHEREHDYHVTDVKLVPPSDISVMDPTADETLTLITCGGTFDPVTREFSDRLIVTAKPL